MPEEMSLEELNKTIDKVFEEVKPTSSKDMGLIMKNISPLVKGRADMSLVNKVAKSLLNRKALEPVMYISYFSEA